MAMNTTIPSELEESTYSFSGTDAGREPAPKGFSGEVLCHDISEIIRSISLSRFDIVLLIKNGPKDGKIIFKGGEIVASICGDLKEQKALSEIQSWKEGYFTLYRIFDGIVCRDE